MAPEPIQAYLLPLVAVALVTNALMLAYLARRVAQTAVVRTLEAMLCVLLAALTFDGIDRYFLLIDREATVGLDLAAYVVDGGFFVCIPLMLAIGMLVTLRISRLERWASWRPLQFLLLLWLSFFLISAVRTSWFNEPKDSFQRIAPTFIPILVGTELPLIWALLRAPTAIFRRQAALVFVGFTVPIVLALANDLAAAIQGRPTVNIAVLTTSISAITTFIAIQRYALFQVEAQQEDPLSGAQRSAARSAPTLSARALYLVDATADGRQAKAAFAVAVRGGTPGLGLVFELVGDVRAATGIEKTPLLRFSTTPHANELDPTSDAHLQMVPFIVEDVLSQVDQGTLVLLDQLERLVEAAGVERTLALLEELTETIRRGSGVLLLGTTDRRGLPATVKQWLGDRTQPLAVGATLVEAAPRGGSIGAEEE